jgi:ABC-type branched-subunit amino acid transport system substrate-binding protein
MIVKELAYPLADPRIDSRVAELKAAGGDVFFNFSVGKLATEAIHQAYDQDWHPLQFIPNASLSTSAFLDPAGLAKATGIITNARSKGWLRPGAARDPDVAAFLAWMKQYNPTASLRDQINVAGYERAEALVAVLQRCGDDLTRANVLKQATSLDLELGMLVPGIRVHTGPDDYQPIKQLYLIRFDGKDWAGMGQLAGP